MGRRIVLLIAAIVVAALGTSLVFVYVNGVNDRAIADQHPVTILVAKKVIATGTKASAAEASGALEQKQVPKVAVADGALSDITPVADQLALTSIYPGQQILQQMFGAQASIDTGLDIPKGKLALSVQLTDPGRVAGFVQPGAHVAVFVQADPHDIKTGKELPQFSRLLLPDVEVLATGPTTVSSTTTTDENGETNTEEIPKAILTLAVDQSQAQKLVLSAEKATLYFALRSGTSKLGPSSETTLSNLFTG